MQLPREPQRGDEMNAAWARQVIRYLRAITPINGPGIFVRQGAGGTSFEAQGGGRTALESHPFKVSTGSAGNKVTVRFGQVNSVTPTIGGTALNADPAPELTITTSGIIFLQVNLDVNGVVVSATIGNAAALPAQTLTEGYITLATVTFAGGSVTAISQAVTHSLGHRRCGVNDHHFWGL